MAAARLKIGDLQKVKNELWEAKTHWKDFGLELSISQNTLDSIGITQQHDPGNCFKEMLADWLRGRGDPPRTWSTIVAALKRVKPLEAIAEDVGKNHGLASTGSSGSNSATAAQSQAACSTTLDQVIDSQHDGLPKHLGLIADSLAEWEGPIADELNLTRADVVSIKLNHPQRFNLQIRSALQLWKMRRGSQATYANLIRVFENAGCSQYADVVRSSLTEGDEYYRRFIEKIESQSQGEWTAEKIREAKPR